MRKNKVMRMASVLLVAVLLTTCMISGTFAKYISSTTLDGTGTATATVAKWDIVLGDGTNEINLTDPTKNADNVKLDLGLFKNVWDTLNQTWPATGEGTSDTDVASGNATTQIIAPGTWGGNIGADAVTIKFTNKSEVNAKYTITAKLQLSDGTLKDIPLEFSIDKGENWFPTMDEDQTKNFSGDLPMASGSDGTEVTLELIWKWAFTDDAGETDEDKAANAAARDELDTELGKLAASGELANTHLVLNVVVEQVD